MVPGKGCRGSAKRTGLGRSGKTRISRLQPEAYVDVSYLEGVPVLVVQRLVGAKPSPGKEKHALLVL